MLTATLRGLSIQELDGLIAAAERERQAKREAARKALVEEVRAKAHALGYSLDTLLKNDEVNGPTARGGRAPARAKYRDPKTGETWSGRGSVPGWLKRLEDEGREREGFAVPDATEAPAHAA